SLGTVQTGFEIAKASAIGGVLKITYSSSAQPVNQARYVSIQAVVIHHLDLHAIGPRILNQHAFQRFLQVFHAIVNGNHDRPPWAAAIGAQRKNRRRMDWRTFIHSFTVFRMEAWTGTRPDRGKRSFR